MKLSDKITKCFVCQRVFHVGDYPIKVNGGYPEPVIWKHRHC